MASSGPPRPTVLLACTAQSLARLRPLLADLAEVMPAFTLDDALSRLGHEPSLIVCNMKFDDSRMLELAAQASRDYPHIPFLCCRTSPSDLPAASMHAADAAAANLGAAGFFDLVAMSVRLGDEEAAARFKARVAELLTH